MIRHAETTDLDRLTEIYGAARETMRKAGNAQQWDSAYPQTELLLSDIGRRQLYVVEHGGVVFGAFAYITGEDLTYGHIEGGGWLNDKPYGAIHHVASDGTSRGIFRQCLDFCKQRSRNLRIDTHENNKTMRHLVEKHGFKRCGIIYLSNGSPRVAYHYVEERDSDL